MRVCGRPRSRRAAQARCRGIADVPDAPVTADSPTAPAPGTATARPAKPR